MINTPTIGTMRAIPPTSSTIGPAQYSSTFCLKTFVTDGVPQLRKYSTSKEVAYWVPSILGMSHFGFTVFRKNTVGMGFLVGASAHLSIQNSFWVRYACRAPPQVRSLKKTRGTTVPLS